MAVKKAILVKPILGGTTDIVQAGPLDGKPVVLIQFEAVDGKRYKPIMLQVPDAERLHTCLTDSILAIRRLRDREKVISTLG